VSADYKFDKTVANRMRKAAKDAVNAGAVELQAAIKDKLNLGASNIGSGGEPSKPGQPPRNNTGLLSKSIQIDRTGLDKTAPFARVGSGLPYARILEVGGTIRPVNVKLLPVPIGVAGRRAQRDAGASLKNDKSLVFIKSKKGNKLLVRFEGTGRRRKMIPLFVLKESVTIRARPYMRPTLAEKRQDVAATMLRFFRAALRSRP
jgi:hypothetical protein